MRTFKTDYLVPAHGVIERGMLFNYMISKGYKNVAYTRDDIMRSMYPFIISAKKKKFMVTNSTIACMHLQQQGKLKKIEELKDILN